MESAATFHVIVQTPNGVIRDPQVPDDQAEMKAAETEEDSKYENKLASKTAMTSFTVTNKNIRTRYNLTKKIFSPLPLNMLILYIIYLLRS